MRVLAAKFPDPERAMAALDTLQREIDNGLQADIAPLATPERTATDTLLAGHFPEEQRAEVRDIVEASGGEIVADVDERWTRPRIRPGSSAEMHYTESGRHQWQTGGSRDADSGTDPGRGFTY